MFMQQCKDEDVAGAGAGAGDRSAFFQGKLQGIRDKLPLRNGVFTNCSKPNFGCCPFRSSESQKENLSM